MPGENELVTVARLPQGRPEAARIQSREGRRMRVDLTAEAGSDFDPGALIEIESGQNLFLGEVRGRQGSLLIVDVEHSLDRSALGAIENVWQTPPAE